MEDRKLTEAKRDKLYDIVEVAGESNRRRDRDHDVAETDALRDLAGMVGLAALFLSSLALLEPLSDILAQRARGIPLIGGVGASIAERSDGRYFASRASKR